MARSSAHLLILVPLILAATQTADAAIIDDPVAGGRSGFFWEEAGSLSMIADLGPDDGVSGEAGTIDWSITLATAGFIDIIVGDVYNRPPTQFDLVIDNVVVPWTQSAITPEEIGEEPPIEIIYHFDGQLTDFRLGAGTHLLTLRPSMLNVDGPTGMISFGPVTPVPAPMAWLGMLTALASVAPWLRCRRVRRD